jgi:hypothetical protein
MQINDIILNCFAFLEPIDLLTTCSCVNKQWNQIQSSDIIWKPIWQRSEWSSSEDNNQESYKSQWTHKARCLKNWFNTPKMLQFEVEHFTGVSDAIWLNNGKQCLMAYMDGDFVLYDINFEEKEWVERKTLVSRETFPSAIITNNDNSLIGLVHKYTIDLFHIDNDKLDPVETVRLDDVDIVFPSIIGNKYIVFVDTNTQTIKLYRIVEEDCITVFQSNTIFDDLLVSNFEELSDDNTLVLKLLSTNYYDIKKLKIVVKQVNSEHPIVTVENDTVRMTMEEHAHISIMQYYEDKNFLLGRHDWEIGFIDIETGEEVLYIDPYASHLAQQFQFREQVNVYISKVKMDKSKIVIASDHQMVFIKNPFLNPTSDSLIIGKVPTLFSGNDKYIRALAFTNDKLVVGTRGGKILFFDFDQ